MRALYLLAILLLPLGCTATIVNEPVVPPQPQRSTCETSYANLDKLHGCGIDLSKFVQNCHDREKFDDSRNRTLPLDCITHAATCDVARRCTF